MSAHHCPGWRDKIDLWHAPYQETLEHVEAMGGADLIAFSPPYCDARTYGMGVSWGDADYAELGDYVFQALKPGGHALVNVDAPVRDWTKDGRGTERGLHPWRLMLDWHDRIGFRVPDRLAFGRHGQPGAFWGFRNDWEPLLWFQRPGAKGHEPDAQAVGRPSVGQRIVVGYTSVAHRRARTGEAVKASETPPTGVTRRGTLWDYGATGRTGAQFGCSQIPEANHPARWPYRLARDLVKCFAPPDGLVVDPFVGAGTTAAAALDNGRRFAGGDLGSRQDHEQNRARGLQPMPWVDVTRAMLTERYRQVGLFGGAS